MAQILAANVHLPAAAVDLIHAHAYEHAPVADGTFPVVLFSPGIGTPPLEYTSTVVDVASHGFVVAVISHTYSVPVTVFADGRVALLNAAGVRSENEPAGTSEAQVTRDRDAIGAVWVADARLVLDQLIRLNAADRLLRGHLDPARVGMYGHSFGGATTAEVLRTDPRVKAGINMDGTLFSPTEGQSIQQPFMWMGSDYTQLTDDQLKRLDLTRAAFAATLRRRDAQRAGFVSAQKPGYLLVLRGSTHSSYISDEAVLSTLVPGLRDPLATLDGRRAGTLVDAYVVAFFDAYLKQRAAGLLDGPSPAYPEADLTVFGADTPPS
jgi:predicted dienelactone hydrolase